MPTHCRLGHFFKFNLRSLCRWMERIGMQSEPSLRSISQACWPMVLEAQSYSILNIRTVKHISNYTSYWNALLSNSEGRPSLFAPPKERCGCRTPCRNAKSCRGAKLQSVVVPQRNGRNTHLFETSRSKKGSLTCKETTLPKSGHFNEHH